MFEATWRWGGPFFDFARFPFFLAPPHCSTVQSQWAQLHHCSFCVCMHCAKTFCDHVFLFFSSLFKIKFGASLTDQLPHLHPHHQNPRLKAPGSSDEIHRLQIQVRSYDIFFLFVGGWSSPLPMIESSVSSLSSPPSPPAPQAGQVNSDPHPPAGDPPGGLHLPDRRVHQGHHQPASHQALHRPLPLLFPGGDETLCC